MPSSNPKQSGSKAPANTTSGWQEYMDTAAEAKGTQVGSEGVKAPESTKDAARSPEDRTGRFLEPFDVSQW